MPILNYTTTIDALKTVGEIQAILVKNGADSVQINFGSGGVPLSIGFQTQTATLGRQFYLYVPDVEGVLRQLERDPKVAARYRTTDQARRVAWRIEKDWLEAMLAKITANSPLEKLMMPYMLVSDGKTMYEAMVERHKALPGGSNE